MARLAARERPRRARADRKPAGRSGAARRAGARARRRRRGRLATTDGALVAGCDLRAVRHRRGAPGARRAADLARHDRLRRRPPARRGAGRARARRSSPSSTAASSRCPIRALTFGPGNLQGLPPGIALACLSETILHALEGTRVDSASATRFRSTRRTWRWRSAGVTASGSRRGARDTSARRAARRDGGARMNRGRRRIQRPAGAARSRSSSRRTRRGPSWSRSSAGWSPVIALAASDAAARVVVSLEDGRVARVGGARGARDAGDHRRPRHAVRRPDVAARSERAVPVRGAAGRGRGGGLRPPRLHREPAMPALTLHAAPGRSRWSPPAAAPRSPASARWAWARSNGAWAGSGRCSRSSARRCCARRWRARSGASRRWSRAGPGCSRSCRAASGGAGRCC